MVWTDFTSYTKSPYFHCPEGAAALDHTTLCPGWQDKDFKSG